MLCHFPPVLQHLAQQQQHQYHHYVSPTREQGAATTATTTTAAVVQQYQSQQQQQPPPMMMMLQLQHRPASSSTTMPVLPDAGGDGSEGCKRSRDTTPAAAPTGELALQSLSSLVSQRTKRTRWNSYIAPRQIDSSTYTSQVGSLVVVPNSNGISNGGDGGGGLGSAQQQQQPPQQPPYGTAIRQVGLRRQLSSSKIEAFLSGGDDSMDVDTEAVRPRSMSF
jgi:hypothetical protein